MYVCTKGVCVRGNVVRNSKNFAQATNETGRGPYSKTKQKKCFKNIEIKYFMRRYARSVNSQKRNISHQHKHSRSRKDAEDGENV